MSLPTAHLLSLPRPDVFAGPQPGAIDTTTLAAHDFDVDTRTGFMPPDPPIARLPEQWEQWENLLDDAQKSRLQLGHSAPTARKWVFEGVERQPAELSGPSAAQSSLVHALDIFLGVDRYSHEQTARENAGPSFLDRMQTYMPRHHRGFLRHLAAAPRPLRALVEESDDADLRGAYNESVAALKRFRDAHIRVVSMYIITPARREQEARDAPLKGTGGTDLVKFLKGVRDRTAGAIVDVEGEP
ncbi:Indoleamine 2,3-dioxygenase-domain-containing protein [Amylostereum chailletii]|nr:Indoleamine 2,3-dioxygenase-domain-containing protein [Amylostereum chailletii]